VKETGIHKNSNEYAHSTPFVENAVNTNKTRLKEKAVEEGKRFAVLCIYLLALLIVFEIHKSLVLRAASFDFGYRFGFPSNA
jgi:hypothetical protein